MPFQILRVMLYQYRVPGPGPPGTLEVQRLDAKGIVETGNSSVEETLTTGHNCEFRPAPATQGLSDMIKVVQRKIILPN